MKKITLFKSFVIASCCVFGAFTANAQFAFTNSNSLLPIASHSGCSVTVVDVNNDGLDDILKMDQSHVLILELQNTNGTYQHFNLGTVPGGTVWGMAAADVDHNGWKDVVTGSGYAELVKLFYNAGVVTATMTQLTGNYFVQNVLFGDFNNDGWVDLEVNDDNDYAKIYQNNAGTLTATQSLITTNINPGLTYGGDPYDSGNYGSVWTDFDGDGDLDLYICHCRQSTNSNTDVRRRDRLFVNNGSNVFTEAAQAHGFEVTDFKQTWTTSFGDMDNDGDMDVVMTNHGEASQILQNNGGMFTDVTAGSGFTVNFDAIESMVEDFDNDGWLDILVTGPNWVMYRNNHDGTYTQTPGVFAGTNFLSFGAGDLNHDGKIDVFASYGNVYNSPTSTDDVLYLNSINNGNHFITFSLTGTVSNPDAIGAKVTIYGPWGKQEREVRAGESYGNAYSMQCHFGIGTNTIVDSARIDWPSHQFTNHFTNLAADQFVSVIEGQCNITGNTISGQTVLCTGQTTTLTAANGFSSYLWSDASAAQSLTVSTTGTYNVTVTNGSGCTNISPTLTITLNPNETPVVSSSGSATACAGTLTLSSTPAASYSWTGPGGFTATTQSVMPMISGNYSVSIVGVCGNFSSTPTTVNVLPAPMPTGTGANSSVPASLTLTAAGSGGALSWYNMATGGTLLTTGASYTTPFLTTTTTYYVDEATSYAGTIGHTGQINHTGASNYSATAFNGADIFDVMNTCTLQSVKIITDSAGTREIDLLNNSGVVIDSMLVTLPADTTVVTLNWTIPTGTGYQLTTKTSVNQTSFGVAAPWLRRSNSGVNYPYTISNVINITGSNQGAQYYYYFYDWVVVPSPTICTSSRVPVVAMIGTTGINSLAYNNGIQIYPNPATAEVYVTFENNVSSVALVQLTDVAGRVVGNWSFDKPAQGQKLELNVNSISAGTYLLNISTDGKKAVQKLVITK